PTGDHELNVSLVCDARRLEGRGARATLGRYLAASADFSRRFGAFPDHAPLRAVSPVSHRVRAVVDESVALVGDAAGFVDPLTGEGIYHALWSAAALGHALAGVSALEPRALHTALGRYARERGRELGGKRRMNRAFQWLIRRPHLVEGTARYIAKKSSRAEAFLGTVGNIYRPFEGL